MASTPTGGEGGQPQAGNGCPANGVKIPAGARTGKTADLDLDGRPDTIWLLDNGSGRRVGVTTATGATFSRIYRNPSPVAARAIGQKLAPAGPAIVLVDLSRAVLLYDVVDCALVPARNAQGNQYTFDRGFTGYGTGVECVRTGSGYTLAGLLAAQEKTGGGFRVTRTTIRLSDFGRQARNGVTTTLARHAATDSDLVQHARTVSCGSGPQVQGLG
ncbi:hypothetical protein [Cryptosporangium aurantiacum]|uniref:Repeat domain-containing protein n=1 Tax=Cryptosporangium aurantiacum TaxID=134849 RepID=A0A1M7RPM9_9ACTN|nr:hypothetical protein [Cryptosporangium aurantiacum]SHN48130.1 hypothetical protein SAMN05443668_13427 [Cryptosporangium aurantiacum]